MIPYPVKIIDPHKRKGVSCDKTVHSITNNVLKYKKTNERHPRVILS